MWQDLAMFVPDLTEKCQKCTVSVKSCQPFEVLKTNQSIPLISDRAGKTCYIRQKFD